MSSSTRQTESFGRLTAQVETTIERATNENVIARIWKKDASLWKQDAEAQANIKSFMGWLEAVTFTKSKLAEVLTFTDEVKAAGFTHAVLCGMGGSSLCPEVLRRVFQANQESENQEQDELKLLVLDSTDPETVAAIENQIKIETTLFIIASKSGSTVEPLSFYRYFYQLAADFYARGGKSKCGAKAGDHFIAITDDGTKMTRDAARDEFRKIFINPSDIGGRYSALSLFGVVPAALIGLNVGEMMEKADAAVEACKDESSENPALRLGCAIGAAASKASADKLTLITDEKLSSLGLWIEQLIAESTGKEGKGIVPVAGEKLIEGAAKYKDDRVFVAVQVDDLGDDATRVLNELEAANQPIIKRRLSAIDDLFAEFFVWEIATAVAGWTLQINPFDQPNVQAAKDITVKLLKDRTTSGTLPTGEAFAENDDFALFQPASSTNTHESKNTGESSQVATAIVNHFKQAKSGESYIALLAYLRETDAYDEIISDIRRLLVEKINAATTFGYGPRYLHSTGQLHKGGANNGVFIVLTDEDETDLDVPESDYSFSVLKQAQAFGDIGALADENRKVLRVHFKRGASAGLTKLRSLLESDL